MASITKKALIIRNNAIIFLKQVGDELDFTDSVLMANRLGDRTILRRLSVELADTLSRLNGSEEETLSKDEEIKVKKMIDKVKKFYNGITDEIKMIRLATQNFKSKIQKYGAN